MIGDKSQIVFLIVVILILLCILGVYLYLNIERQIKIYNEYRVHSNEETGGIVWRIINTEEYRKILMKKYKIKIPEVDFSKNYLLWSSGRRIKKITYKVLSKYKWRYDVPKGIAVFEEKYFPHTTFFYEINKVHVRQDWLRRDELMREMKKSE